MFFGSGQQYFFDASTILDVLVTQRSNQIHFTIGKCENKANTFENKDNTIENKETRDHSTRAHSTNLLRHVFAFSKRFGRIRVIFMFRFVGQNISTPCWTSVLVSCILCRIRTTYICRIFLVDSSKCLLLFEFLDLRMRSADCLRVLSVCVAVPLG